MFKLTTISIVLLITTGCNLLAFYISWQRRKTKDGDYFAFSVLALTLWTLASAFDYTAVPIALKVFFAKWESVFYNIALGLFFSFVMAYVGYRQWLKGFWGRLLIWAPLTINILITVTNDWHGLFWTGFTRSDIGDNILIFQHGPAYYWVAVTGYLFVAAMLAALLRAVFSASQIGRRQARLLFFALLIPLSTNLLYQLKLPGFEGIDWTSVLFSFSVLLFLIALFNTRFLDIVPIARHSLLESMDDCVLVLDRSDRVIDFNSATQNIFGVTNKHIGTFAGDVTPHFSFLSGEMLSSFGENPTIKLKCAQGNLRYFDTHITSLTDHRKQIVAKMVVFREITDRYKIEAALTERVKELKCIYDLSLLLEQPDTSLDEILQKSVQLIANAMQFPKLAWVLLNVNGKIYTAGKLNETSKKLSKNISAGGMDVGTLEVGYQESPQQEEALLDEEKNLLIIMADRLGQVLQTSQAEEKLQVAQTLLLEQQRDLAKVEERRRLARTLHDSVSQSIHSVVLFSETLTATLQRENYERALQITDRLQESARQSHKETRLLLYELQDEGPVRSVHLLDDLEERLNRVERHTGMKAVISYEGDVKFCPAAYAENLYWLATEALNNAIKHAQAGKIEIVLRCFPYQIEMQIHDDGVGFDTENLHKGGMGMRNMHERAKLLNGHLTIESNSGEGTKVIFVADMEVE